MRNKSLLVLVLLSLVILIITTGCLDLFSVPGIAVSTDGQQIYFLSGTFSDEDSTIIELNRVGQGGSPEVVASADEQTLLSAFAVSPVDGAIALVRATEGGDSTVELIRDSGTTALVSLPANSVGTMMAFSPDGSQLAISVITLPPDLNAAQIDSDQESDTMTLEELAATTFAIYLVNVSDGSASLISDIAGYRASMLTWSPDGSMIAYNAWYDANGDGFIQTSGGLDFTGMMGGGVSPDLSSVLIYNVATGTTTVIQSDTLNYLPVFLSPGALAYVALNVQGMMMGDYPNLYVYDVASATSIPAYSLQSLVTGIALSPDGTQVAWAQAAEDDSGEGELPTAQLFVSGIDFSDAHMVAELPAFGLPDAPVWLADNQTVLLSSTNILNGLIGSFTASFSFSTEEGADAEVTSDIPLQRVVSINVADGSTSVFYEGAMVNSALTASMMSLADQDLFSPTDE